MGNGGPGESIRKKANLTNLTNLTNYVILNPEA